MVVAEQEKEAELLESECADIGSTIHHVSAALGKQTPDLEQYHNSSLKAVVISYREVQEALLQEKRAAMEELKRDWEILHRLWSELGTPRNPAEYSVEGNAELNAFDAQGEFEHIDEKKLNPETIRRYKTCVMHWNAEREKRARVISDLLVANGKIAAVLGEAGQNKAGGEAVSGPRSCSFERINELQERSNRLTQERNRREVQMEATLAELQRLYDLLETPAAERISVSQGDLTNSAMEKCEKERHRMTRLKTEKMHQLISSATAELRRLYEEVGMGEGRLPELQEEFREEALLNAIDRESRATQQVIQSYRAIRALIPKRQELRSDHLWVQEQQMDPSRLLDKKKGRTLLEEQRKETRVKRELPPLEARLLELIRAWEREYDRAFVYNGERYATVIEQDQLFDQQSIADRRKRLTERKMDASAVMDKSAMLPAPAASSSAASAAPATARPAQKTAARTAAVAPREVQSAKAATKTQARTVADTPTNVTPAARGVAVTRPKTAALPAPEITTPVARSATATGKYAKVKSKIDCTRVDSSHLKSLTNTKPL